MSSLQLRDFDGWKLAVGGFEDTTHRILDVELARKLGFSKPTTIRDLIKRHIETGDLPAVSHRTTVRQWKISGNMVGREVTEYWLTLEEALFVTAKSETKTANEILKAVIRVFLSARDAIDTEVKQRIGYVARLLLADATTEWDLMWPAEFVSVMCRLHGITWDGRAQPRFLGSTYERIYRTLLTDEIYELLKSKNPEPHHGSNHHQWLTPQARDAVRSAIPRITTHAIRSRTKEEFWAGFDHEFAGKMLQLEFFAAKRVGRKAS